MIAKQIARTIACHIIFYTKMKRSSAPLAIQHKHKKHKSSKIQDVEEKLGAPKFSYASIKNK